jgi:outer membrane biosynthesis protein TonB
VQSSIKDALLNNNKTRTVSISGVIVRIWVDNTAHVTRAQLIGTTGQTSLDNVISDEVLKGLQLKAAPPSDMPMPIVLRLTIRNFSWYTAQVQSSIDEALLNNSKTKAALITGVLIRIWIDRAGRVTRAQLGSQSGDPSIDRVITDEVLVGLQLKEPPPSDMPMPIVLRVTLHRPS